MANLSELVTVRDFLVENPNCHEQDSFACGTRGCVAGWTVALRLEAKVGTDLEELLDVVFSIESNKSIARQARDILGLTKEEASALFYSAASNEDAMELLNVLIEREKGDVYDESLLEIYIKEVEHFGVCPDFEDLNNV